MIYCKNNLRISLLGLFVSASFAGANIDAFSLYMDSKYNLSTHRLLSNDPLDLEQLEQLVEGSADYEEFLSRLKAKYPALFERPVLLHHSASLQYASFDRPRTLLFGNGAVLSFAEDPNQAERTVEALIFDDHSSKFRPAEISFRNATKPSLNKNPTVCAACHGMGSDFRPIWLPYDFWPNAYGSNSGFFSSQLEKEYFGRFLKIHPGEGIYAKIQMPTFENSRVVAANDDFTQYISSLNLMRIMALLKSELGETHSLRYALLASLNGCLSPGQVWDRKQLDMEELLGEHLISKMRLSEASLGANTQESRREMMVILRNQYARYFKGSKPELRFAERLEFENELISPARFILENLGIEWSRFVMSRGENLYSMQIPSSLTGDLGTAFFAYAPDIFLEIQPPIRSQPQDYSFSWAFFDCKSLAQKSREAIAQSDIVFHPLATPHQRPSGSGLAPMASCASCHSTRERAPHIPFEDQGLLRAWLKGEGHLSEVLERIRSGSMPKDRQISAEERAVLEEAFSILAR